MLTVEEVEAKLEAFDREENYGNIYSDIMDEGPIEVPGLGLVEAVASYGGEGMGDDYWVVFKVGDQLFRKDGWYASYDGGYLDGALYEVIPEQVTVTEYRRKV